MRKFHGFIGHEYSLLRKIAKIKPTVDEKWQSRDLAYRSQYSNTFHLVILSCEYSIAIAIYGWCRQCM